MIRTLECFKSTGRLLQHDGRAVPANIVQHLDLGGLVSTQDQRGAAHFHRNRVSDVWNVGLKADTDPDIGEQPLLFQREKIRIGIDRSRQAFGEIEIRIPESVDHLRAQKIT